jgi:hypothetical protein
MSEDRADRKSAQMCHFVLEQSCMCLFMVLCLLELNAKAVLEQLTALRIKLWLHQSVICYEQTNIYTIVSVDAVIYNWTHIRLDRVYSVLPLKARIFESPRSHYLFDCWYIYTRSFRHSLAAEASGLICLGFVQPYPIKEEREPYLVMGRE